MSSRRKTVLKMAGWMKREYAAYSPAERGRRIRKALGDSKSARSFVRRMMPEFYEDAYGVSIPSASGHSVSAHELLLHAKSR